MYVGHFKAGLAILRSLMIAYKKSKEDQHASRSSSNSAYADVGAS